MLLPGAAAAVARLNRAGLRTVLVTNQRWLARPGAGPADYAATHARLVELLAARGARLDAAYHCPHERGACECRKPAPGMLHRAAAELGVDLGRSVIIGDAESDLAAGRAAGVGTILINGVGAGPPRRRSRRAGSALRGGSCCWPRQLTPEPGGRRAVRCLWVTRDYPYPANAGDLIYTSRLVESLAAEGAEVTVLCRRRDGAVPVEHPGVEWRVVDAELRSKAGSLVTRLPSIAYRYSHARMRAALAAELAAGPDVVLLDSVGAGWALPGGAAAPGRGPAHEDRLRLAQPRGQRAHRGRPQRAAPGPPAAHAGRGQGRAAGAASWCRRPTWSR